MQETWVQSLNWEDPLEKELATHSRILALKVPGTEEPGGLQSMGSQRVRHDLATEQCSMDKRRWERRRKHTHGEREEMEGEGEETVGEEEKAHPR